MICIEAAKEALNTLSYDTVHMPETVAPRDVLRLFIKDVEQLLAHNSIKQVPAILQKGTQP